MSKERAEIMVVLHNIRSMYNVGSIFRTSDAFSPARIALGGFTALPPRKEITKTALGAEEVISWSHYEDLSQEIMRWKRDGWYVCAVETSGGQPVALDELAIHASVCFIFGNEVTGLDNEIIDMCDGVFSIPMFGAKESLNVAVSVGVVLSCYRFTRGEM